MKKSATIINFEQRKAEKRFTALHDQIIDLCNNDMIEIADHEEQKIYTYQPSSKAKYFFLIGLHVALQSETPEDAMNVCEDVHKGKQKEYTVDKLGLTATFDDDDESIEWFCFGAKVSAGSVLGYFDFNSFKSGAKK